MLYYKITVNFREKTKEAEYTRPFSEEYLYVFTGEIPCSAAFAG